MSIGHGDPRVKRAMNKILKSGTTYVSTAIFNTPHPEKLAKKLIAATNKKMAAVYLTSSGSEAVEAMLKSAILYHQISDKDSKRSKIISRDMAYHGTTLGALGATNIKARKEKFMSLISNQFYSVSACYPYRDRLDGETDKMYVARKALELDNKFQELGPDTVAAFLMETVVGAALGAVPPVKGYAEAMRDVCHKHGALFLIDEVMCGVGRTGYMYA